MFTILLRKKISTHNILWLYSHSKTIKTLTGSTNFFLKNQPRYSTLQKDKGSSQNGIKIYERILLQNLFKNINSNRKIFEFHLRNFQTFSKNFQQQNRQRGQQNQDEKSSSNGNDGNENDRKLIFYGLAWIIFGYSLISIISMMFPPANKPDMLRYVSWNEFYHQMLAKGEVELIVVKPELDLVTVYLYDGAIVRGRQSPFRSYHMNIVNVPNFESKLREAETKLGIKAENSVQILYERNHENIWFGLLLVLGAVGLMSYFLRGVGSSKGPFNSNIFSNLRRAKFTVIDPMIGGGRGVKFTDVAGLKEAKVEIMEFVDYLQAPERFKKLGAKVPRGVLLLGPPGCGKTMLAKAVATEASVPFLAMNGSEFIEMIGGLGAARVRDLFLEARKRAPCIVYIDEIDAIGRKRSDGAMGGSTGEEEQTLNQLLVEMDGMSQREGIIMLASTNRADILDRALLRPGRFDRHILIDYPTFDERKEIFCQHLAPIKLEKKPEEYAARLSQLTPGFSGADIANVANEAALHAARLGKSIVKSEDLEVAVERVVGGPEKRSGVIGQHEKRIIAFHECGHALVGWLLPHTDALLKVSIVPRTTNVLGFARYLPNDRKLYSKEELFERMCMALGGRVAEQLIFNHVSSGAQNDLQKVTNLAYSQVQVLGMDDVVGLLSFDYENNKFGKKPFSKMLANTIDAQSRTLVSKAHQHTEKLLKDNIDKLKLLAEALLRNEVLNYKDFEKLIGPPTGGKKTTVDFFDLNAFVDENINNKDNNPQAEEKVEMDIEENDENDNNNNNNNSK